MEKILKEIVEKLTQMDNEMKEFRSEMKEVRSEMKEVRSEMKEIKSEMTEIRNEMQDVKQRQEEGFRIQQSILYAQEATNAKLETVEMEIYHMKGDIKRLEEKVDTNHTSILEELSELKSDVEFTYQETSMNKLDIHRLKRHKQ